MIKNKKEVYIILFLSVLIDITTIGIIIPLIPFYALEFGASPSTVTTLFSVYSLMQCLSLPLWGRLSDRFGRRQMVLLTFIGNGLAYLWLSQVSALWMLFVCQFCIGTMSAGFLLATVYIGDITTKENRTRGMGIIGSALGLGSCLGPGISGILVGCEPNYALPCFVAACLSLIGVFIVSFALPESRPSHLHQETQSQQKGVNWGSLAQMLEPPPIGLLILVSFLLLFAQMGMVTIFPVWFQQQFNGGPRDVSYIYFLLGVLCVTVQSLAIGPLSQRYGEAKLLFWGSILASFGLFLMPFSSNMTLMLGAVILQFTGFNICRPTVLNSLLSQAAGAKRQAKILGFAGAVSALAGVISPLWSGLVFGMWGSSWPFWSGAIVMLVMSIFSWQIATSSRLSFNFNLQRQRKMNRLFNLLDFDKNGFIEPIDFEQSVKVITELNGLKVGSPDYCVIHSYWTGLGERLQSLMDTDKDGKITFQEWVEYMGKRLDHNFADIFFQLVDSDKNGEIVLNELKMFYQTYKNESNQEAEASFKELDLNGDGRISREEIREVFEQFMYSSDARYLYWFISIP